MGRALLAELDGRNNWVIVVTQKKLWMASDLLVAMQFERFIRLFILQEKLWLWDLQMAGLNATWLVSILQDALINLTLSEIM